MFARSSRVIVLICLLSLVCSTIVLDDHYSDESEGNAQETQGGITYKRDGYTFVLFGQSYADCWIIGCDKNKSGDVTIPSTVWLNEWILGVKSTVIGIRDGAFSGCNKITGITIPSSVREIGSNAFDGCTSLKYVNLPNSISTLRAGTFKNCTNLERITLGSSITYLLNGIERTQQN